MRIQSEDLGTEAGGSHAPTPDDFRRVDQVVEWREKFEAAWEAALEDLKDGRLPGNLVPSIDQIRDEVERLIRQLEIVEDAKKQTPAVASDLDDIDAAAEASFNDERSSEETIRLSRPTGEQDSQTPIVATDDVVEGAAIEALLNDPAFSEETIQLSTATAVRISRPQARPVIVEATRPPIQNDSSHGTFRLTDVPRLLRSPENLEPVRQEMGNSTDPGPFMSKKEGKRPVRDGQSLRHHHSATLRQLERDSVVDVRSPPIWGTSLVNVAQPPIWGFDGAAEPPLDPRSSTLSHNYDHIDAQKNRQPAQQPPKPEMEPISRWSSSDGSANDRNWMQRLSSTLKILTKRRDSTKDFLKRSSARGSQIISKRRQFSLRMSFGGDGNEEVPSTPKRLIWFPTRWVTPPRDPTSPPARLSPDSPESGRVISARVRNPAPPRMPAVEITPVPQRRQMERDAAYLRSRLDASREFRGEDGNGGLMSPRAQSPGLEELLEAEERRRGARGAERESGPGGGGWV